MSVEHSSDLDRKLLECFKGNSGPILQEIELRKLWEAKDCMDCSNLADHLQKLVKSGRVGVRTLATGDSDIKVYWLRDGAVKHTVASKVPIRTPGSHRQGSKRPRAPFVSPLLNSSQRKRPKLDGVAKVSDTVGKLDQMPVEGSNSSINSAYIPKVSDADAMDNVKGRLDFDTESGSKAIASETSASGDNLQTVPTAEDGKSKGGIPSAEDEMQSLLKEKSALLTRLNEHKEELRKLRMVKMYRTKNDLQGLSELTRKWREVAQDAAQCLLESSTHQPRPSMEQLLGHLHIDPDIIQYATEDESFY